MKRYAKYFINSLVIGLILTGFAHMAQANTACGRGTGEPPFLSYGANSNLLMLIDNSGSMLDTAYVDVDTDGAGPDRETQCFDDGYVPTDLTTDPLTIYGGTFSVYTEDTSTIPPTRTEVWYKWVEVQPLWEHKTYNAGDRVYENGIIYQALSVEVDGTGTNIPSTGANIYADTAVEWIPITRPVWKTATDYAAGSIVYNSIDGLVYRTPGGGTSAGDSSDLTGGSDTGITDWVRIPTWQNATAYAAGDYVVWEDVIYSAFNGDTSNGSKPWDDEDVTWNVIDAFEWKAGKAYYTGDIVTYQGMIFEAQADHTAIGETIYEDFADDGATAAVETFADFWLRLDEGYYEEVTAAEAQTVCDTAAAVSDNTKYTSSGLCISLFVDTSGAGKPTRTTAFAASGNFLNWLMASKFDIQKSILTGGKFNEDAERAISENRGCSGSRFIKQVALNTGFITMAVRGPRTDGNPARKDRIDSTDDTSRIEILAVSATGYNAGACQDAIDKILGHGLNGSQGEIDTCLAGTGTSADMRAALNQALQYCWQKDGTLLKKAVDKCKVVYGSLAPGDIESWANAYNCFGIFDDNLVHDVNRSGYVGRCWDLGTGASASTCDPYAKVQAECDWTTTDPDACEFWVGGTLFRNPTDANGPYREICTQLHNNGTRCQNDGRFDTYYTVTNVDPVDAAVLTLGDECDPTDAIFTGGGAGAAYSGDLDGIPGIDANDTALVPSPIPSPFSPNNTGLTDEAATCVWGAMEDYCDDLSVPEVIDPSDQETSTAGDYGNIPALLVDSGVLSKLGVEVPMNVMKGYIKRLSRPRGILHETASDLRIGGMAFNSVGADTECQTATTTDLIEEYCPSPNLDGAQVIKSIKLGSLLTTDLNSDGDFDIGEDLDRDGYFDNVNEDTNNNGVLDAGEDIDGDGKLDTGEDLNHNGILDDGEDLNGDGLDLTEDLDGDGNFQPSDGIHVDELVDKINLVRATSWTPLAEAVYNAIGYYTQNTQMRLNDGDFQTDSDVDAGWVLGEYYAPDSYILQGGALYKTDQGGISAGDASNLAGGSDTGISWDAISTYQGAWADNTAYNPNSIVSFGGKLYLTVLGGTSSLKDEAFAAGKSGPLFDAGVIWEFMIDPVINYCQGNFLLIITEGASTADISADVEDFALGNHAFNTTAIVDTGEGGADNAVTTQCTDGLKGSTYVDDLTYFAQDDGSQLYPLSNDTLPEADFPFDEKEKNKITTYIVTAGVPRDDGNTDECNPAYLMNKAAENGGTDAALGGENPQQLEDNLLAIFNSIRQRASAGSAASVISSARGGEGAIYQAIFWPELVQGTTTVEWAGDVHGLFLDENGYMYEDTDGNRTLNPSEDLDSDGNFDVGEDLNLNGIIDGAEVDIDGDGIDPSEDLNGNGIFDILADTDGDGIMDTGIDTDGDSIPDASEDIDGDGHFDRDHEDADLDTNFDTTGDQRVIIFFDKTQGVEKSRACFNTSVIDTLGESCTLAKNMEEIHYLWSANQWLSEYPVITAGPNDLTVQSNRSTAAGSFNADSRERYIFTWNDLDKDGIVDNTEVVDFIAEADGGPDWDPVATEFDMVDSIEVDKVIRWMRGEDFLLDEDTDGNGILDGAEVDINGNGRIDPALRSRQSLLVDPDTPANTYAITWRLGDIIHSTPMTVAAPAEGYHLIYNDFSYAQFLARWKNRRHMVYFGANDGMLHAVNAGFYRSLDNKFYLDYDIATGTYADVGPALGQEMWAYVPYNLHPHLKCLTSPLYTHKYFVDQRPRIFDVQIFQQEAACTTNGFDDEGCVHPNGWGTILVGGMRFGGAPVAASELVNPAAGDTREFVSSYFILDITNPEAPPVLLGELTKTSDPAIVDLGYTTVIPTMVIMKQTGVTPVNKWYLVFGSGPRGTYALKGVSDQNARVSVMDLGWMVDAPKKPFRIPAGEPGTASNPSTEAGTFVLNHSSKAFVSDLITVDYDINPSYEEYKADAVYFGTVEAETVGDDGFLNYADGTTYWSGGGHMYRLVMDPAGHTVGSGVEAVSEPDDWETNILLDLGAVGTNPHVGSHPIQPITAAASVGTDGYNFWIYFGTGRFFDTNDKTDRQQQSYYGIKEPMEIVDVSGYKRRKLNWREVELSGTPSNVPGGKGLIQVDDILVGESTFIETSQLFCRDNTDIVNGAPAVGDYSCMPWWDAGENNDFFYQMEEYIAGTGRCIGGACPDLAECSSTSTDDDYKVNCTDGWRKDFWPYGNREKNVGQATLLGGLVTFTTYQPNSGQCQAEGNAYLYGVYYKTGTSWFENIFGETGIDGGRVRNKLGLGRGLATTPNLHVGAGGKDGEGPKAFVQTSTGEIKEIKQENLPIKNYETGRSKWKEFEKP